MIREGWTLKTGSVGSTPMDNLLFKGDIEAIRFILSGAFLVGGPLIGWIVYRFIAPRVRKTATITSWGGDDIVIGALHDIVIWWFSIAGAFVALQIIRFREAEHEAGEIVSPSEPGLRVPIAEGLEKFLVAILIASATWVVARVATDMIKLYSLRTEGTTRSSSLFVVVARVVIFVIGALILLQTLGVKITPLLGALGVGGLAVALAMQDTLSNFFAGLQILATKKVKPGDFIQLETGQEGYVVDIDWRHTSIRQLPNNMILVPNAKLADSILTNYYYPERELSILVQVGVSYESDLERVERVTIDVARQTLQEVDVGVEDFDPFIRYHTFNDFSIDFTVILRAREITDQYVLKHEFVKRLKARYDAEGIVIPFPIRTIDWPQAIREGFGDTRRHPARGAQG